MSTISIQNLTKRYGSVLAVDGLSFDVEPGHVANVAPASERRVMVGAGSAPAGDSNQSTRPPGRRFRAGRSFLSGGARCDQRRTSTQL